MAATASGAAPSTTANDAVPELYPRADASLGREGWASDSSMSYVPDFSSGEDGESGLEDEEEGSHAEERAHKNTPAKPFRDLDDSSDEERNTRKKATGKRKKTKTQNGEEQSTERAPRFNWTTGAGVQPRLYLEQRFDEWLAASTEEAKKDLEKRAAEYVASHWTFPKHNAGDVRKVSTLIRTYGCHWV